MNRDVLLDGPRAEEDITIEEEQDLTAGSCGTGVARGRAPTRGRMRDPLDRHARRGGVEHRPGRVARPVVDDDHLGACAALNFEGGQRERQPWGLVACDHNDADSHAVAVYLTAASMIYRLAVPEAVQDVQDLRVLEWHGRGGMLAVFEVA